MARRTKGDWVRKEKGRQMTPERRRQMEKAAELYDQGDDAAADALMNGVGHEPPPSSLPNK